VSGIRRNVVLATRALDEVMRDRQKRTRFGSLVPIGVLWTLLFLSVMASTRVGALIFGETWPFLLTSFGLLFASCVVVPLVGIVMSVRRRQWKPLLLGLANLPGSLLLAYLALALAPGRALINRVRGQPVLAAHYEGTQNAATLTLRNNGHFDVFWSGWPGTVHFFKGSWYTQGPELRLQFEDREPPLPDRGTMAPGVIAFGAAGDRMPYEFVIEKPPPR